jgi:hypothetical protein
MIKVFAFNLFGTLVDITSISKVFPEIGVKLNDPNYLQRYGILNRSNML